MARKKPTRQQAREAYNKSEAPYRIAAEKDERVVADTNLATKDASHDTSLTNVQNTNASQNTSLSDLGARMGAAETALTNAQNTNAAQNTSIGDLGSRMGNVETRISNQETVNNAQQATLVNLETFRTRAAGFAAAVHDHNTDYYTKTRANDWFLRHAQHPQGNSLHGDGYHAVYYLR